VCCGERGVVSLGHVECDAYCQHAKEELVHHAENVGDEVWVQQQVADPERVNPARPA
jgi:hypothetical protein